MKDERVKQIISVILIVMMLSTGVLSFFAGENRASVTSEVPGDDTSASTAQEQSPKVATTAGAGVKNTNTGLAGGDKADMLMQPVYSDIKPASLTQLGNKIPAPMGIDEYSGIGGAHAMGYNGSGVNVAVVDTGVDFGHIDMQGTQMVEPETMNSVNEPVLPSAAEGTDYVLLGNDSVVAGTLHVYKNGAELAIGTDYTVDYATGNITFATPLSLGDRITASYTYNTPYGGWPVTFDPTSMKKFLSTGSPRSTMFADTSKVGTGPFELFHDVNVDGKNDFYNSEDIARAPRTKEKKYFDLTDLNVTYDQDNWYFGFPVYGESGGHDTWMNATIGLAIDKNNGTSGSESLPGEMLINTNASHSSFVTDVAFSPDGSKVASTSMDKSIRVWNTNTGLTELLFEGHKNHNNAPFSLVWSPNGTMITSVDHTHLIIWNATTGQIYHDIEYPGGHSVVAPSTPFKDLYEKPKSSFISISPNGTWLAVGQLFGGTYRVYIYNLMTGGEFGRIWIYNGDIYSVSFDSTGKNIALGCDNKNIYVVELNSTNIMPPSQPVENDKKAVIKYTLSGHTAPVLSVDWSPDDSKIVSGGRDGTVIIWNNLANDSQKTTIPTTTNTVPCVYWSPDNSGIFFSTSDLSGKNNQTFYKYAYNPSTYEVTEIYNITQNYPVYAFSSHGQKLVTAGGDTNVNIWENSNGAYDNTMLAHKADFVIYLDYHVKKNKDGKWEKSTDNPRIYIWNPTAEEWDIKTLSELGSEFASKEWGVQVYNELSIPRTKLSTNRFSMELFIKGYQNVSCAQDSVPEDFHILDVNHNYKKAYADFFEPVLHWNDTEVTPLSDFVGISIEYYTVSGIESKSNTYHFGFHPSFIVSKRLGGLGILVTDSQTAGVYDRVYLDFNGDHVFDKNDVNVSKDQPLAIYDNDGDGFPDFDAGMVYFISSAEEISDELVATGQANNDNTTFQLKHKNLVAFPEPVVKLNGNKWLDQKMTEKVAGDIGASTIKLSRKFVIDSSLEVDAKNMSVLNESSFKVKDGKVWYELSHTDDDERDYTYSGYSLYADIDASSFPSVPTWLSGTPAHRWVKLSSDNYTLYQNGSVKLNKPTIKWPFSYYPFYTYYPLPAGTKIYAFYNFTGPLVANDDYTFSGETGLISLKSPLKCSLNGSMPTEADAAYSYHPYRVDKENGIISLATPLNTGEALEISYDYDGKYLPYSSVYAKNKGLTNLAAGNGDMVAFSGELREKKNEKGGGLGSVTDHGTRVASAIASQTRNPWANITSAAPGAKLISIMDGAKSSNVEDAWYFAVNGYDGYPNTGDEANVVVSAFTYPMKVETGFDYYSRLADYISTEYTNGSAIFVGSAGSAGFGYGTVPSPGASPSMLTVGGIINMGLYMDSKSIPEGPYPDNSEIDPLGGRGPTMMGAPKPELLTTEMGYVDIPPQALPYNSGNKSFTGTNQIWISDDYATAVTAGSVAVLMQAYQTYHGEALNVTTARKILMSSSDDFGYDSLIQGSGELNLTKAVFIAINSSSAGICTDKSLWNPGAYRGEHYEGFTNIMMPGTTSSTEVLATNHGSKDLETKVESSVYKKIDAFDYTNKTSTYKYTTTIFTKEHTLIRNSIIFVLNDTGLYAFNETPTDQRPDISKQQNYPVGRKVMDINSTRWNDSDMLRVTAYADMDNYSTTTPSQGTKFNYTSFSLKMQGWDMGPERYLNQAKEDLDGTNYYKYVQYANCTFPTENDFTAYNTSTFASYKIYDTNTITISSGHKDSPSNVLQVETSNPKEKAHDGIIIFMDGDGTKDGIEWNFHIELFKKTNWTWVSINDKSSDTLNIPAGGDISMNLKMSVPTEAHMGTYEGSIKLETSIDANRADVTTIPVVVNVASDKGTVSFGGMEDQYLMNPTAFMGGYNLVDEEKDRSGDWRYFYVDIPSTGIYSDSTGKSLTVDLKWNNKPTDLDIIVFKPGSDSFSGGNPHRYGPSGMKEAVKSKIPVKYIFNTVTNESEEILATDLSTGLHVFAVRPVMMAGVTPFENISSMHIGVITHSTDLSVQTRNFYDTGNVFFSSTLPFSGLNASAVGPANSETYTDIPIPQDYQSWWNFPTWPEWLVRGSYTKVVHVEDALIFDVHIWGHSDSPDLDLGVFYDANGDGIAQPSEFVATCADADADEEVKLTNPVDGDYIIKVLGFDDADPGHFDITISIILATGEGYKITGLDPSIPYSPGNVVSFGMVWNFPGNSAENEYMGAINVGPKNAPSLILIPVSITLDATAPTVTEVKPGYNEVVNTPDPTVLFSFSEANTINTGSAVMTVDGIDYTRDCKVTDTSIIYTPKSDMEDGIHIVNASIADVAGNMLSYSWVFTIDTSTSLGNPNSVIQVSGIDNDGFAYTDSSTYTISGRTTAGTHFTVNGQDVETNADGSFTVTINLTDGTNIVNLVASDDSGKSTTRDIFVVYDTTAPSFSVTPSSRLTRDSSVTLSGKVELMTETGPVSLTVNGKEIPINTDGTFDYDLMLAEGQNTISVTATDAAGNSATTEISVRRDSTAPSLSLEAIPDTVSTKQITISGNAESGSKVFVNGKQVITSSNGEFSTQVSLSTGSNLISISAVDAAGNSAEHSFSVVYQPDEKLSAAAITTTSQVAPALTSTAAMLLVIVAIIFLLIGFIARKFMKKGGEGGTAVVEPVQEIPVEEEPEPATEIEAEEPPEEEHEEAEEPPEQAEAEDISDNIIEEALVENETVEEGEPLEEGPFDLGAAIENGKELLAAGDNVRAVEIFEKAIENAPDEVEGYLGKAQALDALGKWGQALQMVNKALEVNPQATEALEFKGDIFAGQGKTEMARSAYEQALEIEPGNTDIRNKLEKLD